MGITPENLVLAIRSDQPRAEIYLLKDQHQLGKSIWQADHQLSQTLLTKIEQLLNERGVGWEKLTGIVVYEGPGSFTGLRIGISVANALAYGLNIPVVATGGKNWLQAGAKRLNPAKLNKWATPRYGAPPRITKPRK